MSRPIADSRADLRLGAVLAAAAIVAVATTRLAVHIAPSYGLLGFTALLLTAALAAPERRRPMLAVAGSAFAGLAASHVLFRPGMPQVHDLDHVWGLWAYARAVHAGHPVPMWLPDLGAGMPLLQFYGPVNFMMALPGVLAGAAPVTLWKEAFVQAGVLSAIATLAGARLLGAGWRASLIAACAMAFAPWRLTVFNLRGAMGEATALIFAPLVAASALALLRERSRAAGWTLAASVALLIPTHLLTLFCLSIVLIPTALAQEAALRRDRGTVPAPLLNRLAGAAAPVVLATGLLAVWWLPALAEGTFTSLSLQTETHGYLVFDEHGLKFPDLAVRRAWDTQRLSLKLSDRAAGSEGQQMPFYIGAVLFGAALTAPWWSRSRATWAPATGAAAGVLFASAPVAAVMTFLPSIHKIQFPWRFLTAASIFAAYAVALGVAAVLDTPRSWKRLIPVLALPALLICDAAPYTGAAGWIAPYHGVTHWVRREGVAPDAPFDVAMRAVAQDWSNARGLVRVGGLSFPPDDSTTPVALFWIPYVEWTTPAIYHGFMSARGPRDFAEAGVTKFFLEKRDQPAAVAALPYATFENSSGVADAGAFTRGYGRITLRPDVPDGGARLVLREQAFPGWEARVDGHEATIAATPLGFMALDLPAGIHDVVLEFTAHTMPRRAGLGISALTLVLAGIFARKRGLSPRSSSRRG
jgi:hypothetical protein